MRRTSKYERTYTTQPRELFRSSDGSTFSVQKGKWASGTSMANAAEALEHLELVTRGIEEEVKFHPQRQLLRVSLPKCSKESPGVLLDPPLLVPALVLLLRHCLRSRAEQKARLPNVAVLDSAGRTRPQPAVSTWPVRTREPKVMMYRIKIKVQTHPLNTRVTTILLGVTAFFTAVIVGFKLYRIASSHGEVREEELSGWFDPDAFIPDKLPHDLEPDMYTLSINATNVSFTGNVTINLICRKNTTYLLLHAAPSLTIISVDIKDMTGENFTFKVFDRLRDQEMLIIKTAGREFIPPRTYLVAISFAGVTRPFPEHTRGLVSVTQPGGYESILFLNEARASRQVFPSFNRHSFRAGFKLDGIVRRGLVLCSSQRPIDDLDDELVENNGGPGDIFRVRFATIVAITSDRLSWFQTNLFSSAPGARVIMWNTKERLKLMKKPQMVFVAALDALDRTYSSLTIPTRIHVVHLPAFNRTMVCWGIVYSSRFEADVHNWPASHLAVWELRFQMMIGTILASFTFSHTVTPRWANDDWFFYGLSAAIAYDSMENVTSIRQDKPWLVSYRHLAFKFEDAMNRITPDTFDFVGSKEGTMLSKALLVFLLYKDCYVGTKEFRGEVENFVAKYKFMTTNSDSAVAILTSDSTYQKKYFYSWANKPGHPVVIAERLSDPGERDSVRLRQAHFSTAFVQSDDTWLIPVQPEWILLNGSKIIWEREILMGDLNTEIRILPVKGAALLLFPDIASPARTLYDARLWASLFALLDSPLFGAVPTINRAAIQQDLGAFVRNGDVGITLYMAGIRYLWRETSRAVWRTFAKELREIHEMASKIPLKQLDEFVYKITTRHQPPTGDSDGGLDFDLQTRPFVEEVQCILGSFKCDETVNDLDEWNFVI